jgi:hypothetical protein
MPCPSSSNGLKSLIDLFNGMDNVDCIVDPPKLYVVFLKQFVLMDPTKKKLK